MHRVLHSTKFWKQVPNKCLMRGYPTMLYFQPQVESLYTVALAFSLRCLEKGYVGSACIGIYVLLTWTVISNPSRLLGLNNVMSIPSVD